MKPECGMTNGRRGFLKKLLGVIVAPKVVEVVPAPAARYEVGVDLAADYAVDAMRYVMVTNAQTGRREMFRYIVEGGESIGLEKLGGAVDFRTRQGDLEKRRQGEEVGP